MTAKYVHKTYGTPQLYGPTLGAWRPPFTQKEWDYYVRIISEAVANSLVETKRTENVS